MKTRYIRTFRSTRRARRSISVRKVCYSSNRRPANWGQCISQFGVLGSDHAKSLES